MQDEKDCGCQQSAKYEKLKDAFEKLLDEYSLLLDSAFGKNHNEQNWKKIWKEKAGI
jgi:hypothetical protein